MFETTSEVFALFGQFAFIGFILGFIYDIGRFFRISLSLGRIFTFVHDFFSVFLGGMIIFIFSVELGVGNLRFFYIFAALLGFTVYLLSLGNLTALIARAISKSLKKLLIIIKTGVIKLFHTIKKTFYPKCSAVFVKIKQKKDYLSEKCKIHLKNSTELVYNNSNSKIGKVSQNGGENRNVIKAKVKKNTQ